jgi:hypothetical protein
MSLTELELVTAGARELLGPRFTDPVCGQAVVI